MRAAFDRLVERIADTPVMTPAQGWKLWQHFERAKPRHVLDIGTFYGASTAYMAGALKFLGGGRVVTVDTSQMDQLDGFSHIEGHCRDLLKRCGVADIVEMIRTPHGDYAWWLDERVRQNIGADGRCRPEFDFAYLDGDKTFALNAGAVVLIEKVLNPGGWLLMDDLSWCYDQAPDLAPVVVMGNGRRYELSSGQRQTPMLRAVFDDVVARQPSFGNLSFDAEHGWGWAQKLEPTDRAVIVVPASELRGTELLHEAFRRGTARARRHVARLGRRRHERA
jgi:predicted O-methyltransferase YrrM